MTTSFHAEGGDTKLWLAVDGLGTNFEEVRRRWAASFAADGHDLYPWGLELRPIWEVVERIDAAKGVRGRARACAGVRGMRGQGVGKCLRVWGWARPWGYP